MSTRLSAAARSAAADAVVDLVDGGTGAGYVEIRDYRITSRITTSQGRVDDRTMLIRVRER